MNRAFKIIASGAVAILAFDVLASLAARALGFPYAYATIGSWAIYVAVGFSLGRLAPVSKAVLGTVIVAFVEATIGWWLSWLIGPGRPPTGAISLNAILITIVTVLVMGAIIGAIAGFIGHSRTRFDSPESNA